jgi:5-methyltetrahydrofolate--homocysteine methyltransferase
MHTAVKISPVYDGPIIHVLDASRAVTVCSSLLDATLKQELMDDIHETYTELREEHYAGLEDRKFLSLAETRAKKPVINWSDVRPTAPASLGNTVLHDVDVASLVPYIDWTPFFDTWQLKGKYPNKKFPKIFQDETVGAEAKRLYDEASLMLQDIIRDKSIQARGVFGIYPANSDGDDILVYADETRSKVVHRFHSLRQQEEVPGQNTYLAMADFIAPVSSGVKDYIGAFAVSAGFGADALCAKYEAENDDYRKIMTQALADRLAEAFAEKLHRDVRVDHWGYSKDENVDTAGLLQVKCAVSACALALPSPHNGPQIHRHPAGAWLPRAA